MIRGSRWPRRAPVLAAGLVAAVTLPITGCDLPFAGEGTPSTDPTTSSTPAPAPTGAGRQLTDEEALAALPAVPQGAKAEKPPPESTGRETDPAECIDLLRIGETATALRKDRVGNGVRQWSRSKPSENVSMHVESFPRPVGPELLDKAGAAMGDCDAFSLTGSDGSGDFDMRVLAEPLPVSPLGEQNYAARITTFGLVDGKSQTFHLDYVVVRVGHNLIEVSKVSQGEDPDVARLETWAQEILESLEE